SASKSTAPICTPATLISVPFTKDGAGDFCYQTTTLCTYINSWNLTALEVNGTAYTNILVAGSSIAPVNGTYAIHYVSTVAWGHFEIGAPCSGSNPTASATVTLGPSVTRTNTPASPIFTPTRTFTPPAVTPTRTNTPNSFTPTRTNTPPAITN